MKKRLTPHSLLFIITAIVAVFTWFIPGGAYVEGVYEAGTTNPQGLYAILSAPIKGIFNAMDIILFILVIGAFITTVMKTGALQAGISSLTKNFKGREIVLIPLLMPIFAIGGTTFGMCEETVAFYALLAPIMLAAGFDVVVALLVIFLGSAIGVLASTVNPFAVGAAVAAAEDAGVAVGLGDGLLARAILLVILTVVGIIFTMRYAKKVQADPSESIVADYHEENVKRFAISETEEYKFDAKKRWILFLFALTFIVMIIGVIPWAWKFEIYFFDDMYNKIADGFFGKILGFISGGDWDNYDQGGVVALGDWWFGQLTVWFFIMNLVIGWVHSLKNPDFGENELVGTMFEGFKDFTKVAMVVGVARGIKIILEASGVDATILHSASSALEGLPGPIFAIGLLILFIVLTFFISSTSGLAAATMPIIAPLAEKVMGNGGAAVAITAYSMGSGIMNIVTPTGIAIVSCTMLNVPYGKYVKFMLPLLGIITLICAAYVGVLAILV